jgi:hypothetical protein
MKIWKLYIAAAEKFWFVFLAVAVAASVLFWRSSGTGSNVLDFLSGVAYAFIIMGAALGTMSAINKRRASSSSENAP